jgi:hypothetical protein
MVYATIRAAEPWTVGSVLLALLLLALAILWWVKVGRRP